MLCLPGGSPATHDVDADPARAFSIRQLEHKYVSGSTIRYCFMTKPAAWAGSSESKDAGARRQPTLHAVRIEKVFRDFIFVLQ